MCSLKDAGLKVGDTCEVKRNTTSCNYGDIVTILRDDCDGVPKCKNHNTGRYVYVSQEKLEKVKFDVGFIVEISSNDNKFSSKFVKGDRGIISSVEENGAVSITFFTSHCVPLGDEVRTQYCSHPSEYLRVIEPPKYKTYEPITITLETIEEAKIMRDIMHLCNKVADSSYFNLDFTADREDVREYMRAMHADIKDKIGG